MAVTVGPLTVTLVAKKRWWFEPARLATIALIMLGVIKNTDKAAEWLIRKGYWFGSRIGEGRVQSLGPL
jgi:hypothetical protein